MPMHRICAITGVRIKVTTEINSPDPQVQWALNALLVNLEVKLGIINACLPVMKPVFKKLRNKLRHPGPFTASSIWSPQWKLKRDRHIRRDYYHEFSDDCSPKGQVSASKSSTFPLQQLSRPYCPQYQWGKMATSEADQVTTQIDVGHHRGI